MDAITGKQIKMARAYMDWPQSDLAQKTGFAETTIRKIERGKISRGKTAEIIRKAFEEVGLEFTPNEGVRRCVNGIEFFYGDDSCEQFFNHVLKTVRTENNNDVCAYVFSEDTLIQCSDAPSKNPLARLEQLNRIANVRCLVPEREEVSISLSQFQFRYVGKEEVGPEQYYVYGNNHAVVLDEGSGSFRFVVFQSPSVAYARRKHFQYLWDNAIPQILPVKKLFEKKSSERRD